MKKSPDSVITLSCDGHSSNSVVVAPIQCAAENLSHELCMSTGLSNDSEFIDSVSSLESYVKKSSDIAAIHVIENDSHELSAIVRPNDECVVAKVTSGSDMQVAGTNDNGATRRPCHIIAPG